MVENDYYEGNINSEKRDALMAKYDEERDYNFSQMKALEKEIKTLSFYASSCRDLERFAANMKEGIAQLTYEEKTNLVNMLVEKIEVSEEENERKCKVFFRFKKSNCQCDSLGSN